MKDNYSSVCNIILRSWFSYNFSFKSLTATWRQRVRHPSRSHITYTYDFLRKRVNPTHSLGCFHSTTAADREYYAWRIARIYTARDSSRATKTLRNCESNLWIWRISDIGTSRRNRWVNVKLRCKKPHVLQARRLSDTFTSGETI